MTPSAVWAICPYCRKLSETAEARPIASPLAEETSENWWRPVTGLVAQPAARSAVAPTRAAPIQAALRLTTRRAVIPGLPMSGASVARHRRVHLAGPRVDPAAQVL